MFLPAAAGSNAKKRRHEAMKVKEDASAALHRAGSVFNVAGMLGVQPRVVEVARKKMNTIMEGLV